MEHELDEGTLAKLLACIKSDGLRAVARQTGVSTATLSRLRDRKKVKPETLRAVSLALPAGRTPSPTITPPRGKGTQTSWPLASIRAALELQLLGSFCQPKRLAEAMRRDDAIYTARSNRIAPISAVAAELTAHRSARGKAVAKRSVGSVVVPKPVLAGVCATLVDHGVAVGKIDVNANKSGTRQDFTLSEWPLEHVRWNPNTETLETPTRDGPTVPIAHGDGTWVVFQRYATTPWREDACLIPACFVWAAHSEALGDWNASSRAHGLARLIGELPEGAAISDENGNMTEVGEKFLDMLNDIVAGESPAGVRPAGSKTEFIANASGAWQVFSENVQGREKAAARIYLGTDATLGSVGGAPGVDISALFGVASTKIQGDLSTIESCLYSGLYVPWTAANYGDPRYAPRLTFLIPDPDEDKKRQEKFDARKRLADTIEFMRAQKLEVNQTTVDRLAEEFGVRPAPKVETP